MSPKALRGRLLSWTLLALTRRALPAGHPVAPNAARPGDASIHPSGGECVGAEDAQLAATNAVPIEVVEVAPPSEPPPPALRPHELVAWRERTGRF
ncbi:MAG: hypothetical protein FWD17_04340 [Polyangiaceae bacterium]|nr:hypothetical protein [Polyangiaceae bacterium]